LKGVDCTTRRVGGRNSKRGEDKTRRARQGRGWAHVRRMVKVERWTRRMKADRSRGKVT